MIPVSLVQHVQAVMSNIMLQTFWSFIQVIPGKYWPLDTDLAAHGLRSTYLVHQMDMPTAVVYCSWSLGS